MQLHDIKPKNKRRKAKLVGRGGKRGTTSGKGTKGQKARAGRKMRPELRDLIKKIHKKRGYAFNPVMARPAIVNLEQLQVFAEGDRISPQVLFDNKLIRKQGGALPSVKILGTGDTKKFVFSGCLFSESARKKIEDAKGTIEVQKVQEKKVRNETKSKNKNSKK